MGGAILDKTGREGFPEERHLCRNLSKGTASTKARDWSILDVFKKQQESVAKAE